MPRELAVAQELERIAIRYGTTPWDVAANAPAWMRLYLQILEDGEKK